MTEQQKGRLNTLVQRHLEAETEDVDDNVLLEICELIRRGLGGEFMLCVKEPLKHGAPPLQHKVLSLIDQVVNNTSDTFLIEISSNDWCDRLFRVCKTTVSWTVTERIVKMVVRWGAVTSGMRKLCERMSRSKVLGTVYTKQKELFDESERSRQQRTRQSHSDPSPGGGGGGGGGVSVTPSSTSGSGIGVPAAAAAAVGGSGRPSVSDSQTGHHNSREAMMNIDTFLLEVQGDMAGLEYGIQNPEVLDRSIVEDCARHKKRLGSIMNNNRASLTSDVSYTILLLLEQLQNLLSFHDAIYNTEYAGQGPGAGVTPVAADENTPQATELTRGAGGVGAGGAAFGGTAAPTVVAVGASGVDAAERAEWATQMEELQLELSKARRSHEEVQAKYKDAKVKNRKAIETIEELEVEKDAADARAAAAVAAGGAKPKVVTKEKIVKVRPQVSAAVLRAVPDRLAELRVSMRELKRTGQSLRVENERFAADLRNGVARLSASVGAESEKDKRALHALGELYKREVKLRKQYYNQIQELKGNIRVYCRIRPMSAVETGDGHSDITKYPTEDEIVIVDDRGRTKAFEFDAVFAPTSTQEAVFEDTKPLIDSVVDGYNVCIFAYGQTGSGKTHTMTGTREQPGINSRALDRLFNIIDDRSSTESSTVSVSILEIYMENIRDLLVSKADAAKTTYDIRTGGKYGHFVTNMSELDVKNPKEIEKIMDKALLNRSQASTNMNQHSSRSHMIVYIIVKTTNLQSHAQSFGKMSLVDLAGSERLDKSGAEGQVAKEAASINKSLTALGDTIASLSQSAKHVPYRNSTLTHLLQDSMAGQAKVLMFCCASPASYNAQETSSSLMFATRARGVSLGQAKKN